MMRTDITDSERYDKSPVTIALLGPCGLHIGDVCLETG